MKHLQNMYAMIYICTFQVYRLGEHPNDFLLLSNETMYQFGTGFRNTNLRW